MKHARSLSALAGLALGAASVQAQVYPSPNVPVTITDNATFTSTISVAGGPASITDLNVVMTITHSFDGDLDIILQGPSGLYICLTSDNGGLGDNFQTTRFDDAGSNSITSGAAPFNDNYRPEGLVNGWAGTPAFAANTGAGSLSGFNGTDSNGTWTLYIADDAGGDSGALTYWSIELNGAVDPNGPPPATTPTSPSGTGTPTAGAVNQNVNFRVAVVPGQNPISTGLNVTVDASSISLGSVQLFDDGNHNDGAAGDYIFGADRVIPGSVAGGTYALSFAITDAQNRSGSGTWNIAVENLAGQIPASPIVPQGSGALASIVETNASGARSYLYQIDICDPSNFSASTVGGTAPLSDTQLFLFDSTGKGVVHNDDVVGGTSNESAIPSGNVSSSGTYYLALSFYNRDPVTASGALIWANTPFRAVRTPDGAEPANPVTGWTGTSAAASTVTISLTGACYPSSGPSCNPDYNDDGNVDQDDIAYLVNVVAGGANPLNRDPDFNRDGNADQDDIGSLVGVVAGSPCP